ncbi:MAG: hypothetical protein L6R28_10780 [Planctomycetes bacterium]|nr:hypothetical protein [Planctomycetota bacterium]
MSWFEGQPLPALEADDDERAGAEVADGVLIERREVLFLSLGAMAALALGWPQRAMAEEGGGKSDLSAAEGDLAFDALIREAVPKAEELVKSEKANEDAYLHGLAALVARLKAAPDGKFKGQNPVEAAKHYDKQPFMVVQFKLQPGAALPWHDHRDYNGILSCVQGEARVKSYDIVGDNRIPPKGQTFNIQETGDRLMKVGTMSQLTRTRDNVHDVRAGKDGARLLDFFTFYKPSGTSVFMNVEAKPADAEKRIYEATWK